MTPYSLVRVLIHVIEIIADTVSLFTNLSFTIHPVMPQMWAGELSVEIPPQGNFGVLRNKDTK